MAVVMRQYDAPSDFKANAESDLIYADVRGGLYKAFTHTDEAQARKNLYNPAVDSTIVGAPTFTSDSIGLTANVGSGLKQLNTGIIITGDVVMTLGLKKNGNGGAFSSTPASSNTNIVGFQTTATEVQFHNGNSSGSAAKALWPADIGTKFLFCVGWGIVHGFPHMLVGLNGVLGPVTSGPTAGGDRTLTDSPYVWMARPNGGSGAQTINHAAIFAQRVIEEAAWLAKWQYAYTNLRALFPDKYY